MKRIFTWGVVITAAFLCAVSGLYFYRVFINYADMQKEINRQVNEINRLRLEQSRYASCRADTRSVSETVSFLSTHITGFDLTEKSLLSEKSNMEYDGWEEWRIEAVYTGSIKDLGVFIESLEAAGTYHNLSFTVDINDDNMYELSIELRFYTRRV